MGAFCGSKSTKKQEITESSTDAPKTSTDADAPKISTDADATKISTGAPTGTTKSAPDKYAGVLSDMKTTGCMSNY